MYQARNTVYKKSKQPTDNQNDGYNIEQTSHEKILIIIKILKLYHSNNKGFFVINN